jgi:hypothetical protein
MVFSDRRRLAQGGLFAVPVLVILAVALAGCHRRDPLDWRVNAKNLNAYNSWMHDVSPELGDSLQKELAVATHNLALMTIGFKWPEKPADMYSEHDPFCRRIHGRTVRQILIDYYAADNERLMDDIARELDTLTSLYRQSGERDDKRVEHRIPQYEAQIAANKEVIRRNTERIRQLRGEPLETKPAPADRGGPEKNEV